MIQKKPITESQALKKLGDLCAKSERCSGEVMEKMYKWGLPEETKARIMEKLIGYGYIDDSRYTETFVHDKIKFNKWGRRKIEQALWQKRIDSKISTPILDSIEDEEYLEVLRPLLKSKYPTIKAESDYERSMKLIKYAMGKGFTYDLIKKAVADLGEELVGNIEDVEDF